MILGDSIVDSNDLLLITGSNGFIGSKVVEALINYGYSNLRCLVRPSSNLATLNKIIHSYDKTNIEIVSGNLLSTDDCNKITQGVSVIFHLAAGIEKTFAGCFMNSVVTTKNLLDSVLKEKKIKRFVNVSSFSVYSNMGIKRNGLLDETCEIESELVERHESYCFGKVKQDEIVMEYNKKHNIPYVIIRPGAVYGPGVGQLITSRIGIDTFGVFLHLGGPNTIPYTYVDNCAEAVVLGGIKHGADGEIFNVIDDDLPRSRDILKMYKKNVRQFKSIYIPYRVFYFLCYMWEEYSRWSDGQLPPVFNRRRCASYWKGNQYSNKKIKDLLGWNPKVPFSEAIKRHFEYCRIVEMKNA